jgi:hypothetical protein
MTQQLAAVKDSVTLPKSILGLNAHWLTLDVNSADEYARRNLSVAVAKAGGPPCLIVQGSPSTPGGPSPVISSVKAPADEASTLSAIKATLGGN